MRPELTLVTDAYTASNIGDLELVRRTVGYAGASTPTEMIVCLAVDPASFDTALGVPVADKLFPRLHYVSSGRLRRVAIAAQWAWTLVCLSMLTALPTRMRRGAVTMLVSLKLIASSADLYARAKRVIAVGGGYLGDQYLKDTLLTTWTWWWASRLGCHVETMPVSFEVRGRALGKLVAAFTRRVVVWRARDSSSKDALARLGIEAPLIPDLAFANYRSHEGCARRGTVVALVGSDYLDSAEQLEFLDGITTALGSEYAPRPFTILNMHRSMAGTAVGGDHKAALVLAAGLRARQEDVSIAAATTYADVCNVMRSADVAITARMHAGIAALASGARIGMIAYEEKHFALMRDLGLSEFVRDIRSGPQVFVDLIARVSEAPRETFDSQARRYAEDLGRAGLVQPQSS